jgi:hypothetical protein
MAGGYEGEQPEIVHAPAVAEVQRMILGRPHYLRSEAIAIEPQLWVQAQEQLKQALEKRGWPLLADGDCHKPNFLLLGVPVVSE